jgi:hypothetical protein
MNRKVHYCVLRNLPLALNLSQMNPVHKLPPYFFKIYSNLILHLCVGIANGLFAPGFSTKKL